jgi:succinate dehydrogenase / fumarate reductase cytochrome b subunit
MSWFVNFYRSAIGKKAVMAVTGIMLFGFVLVHMIGNLKLYLGESHLNEYGEWLRAVGAPALPHGGALWIARIVLLLAVVLHIDAALKLTIMNRKARPIGYRKSDVIEADYASRTMRWGGVIIFLFVIYHLMHFTWGNAHPDFRPGEPYHNLVVGFSIWWVSLFYILANLALGFHLYHGLWSMFQSLGWNHPRFNHWRRSFAVAFAIIVTLGNISFPLSVMSGLVGPSRQRIEGPVTVSNDPASTVAAHQGAR